jgi:replicative DNA helicase
MGYKTLDDITYGVRPTELTILAGRPGMGKTASMCDMILHISESGVPLVFSMEMGYEQLIERLLCNIGNVSYQGAIRNLLQSSEKKRLLAAADTLSKRDIIIEGASLRTPQQVEHTIRTLADSNIHPSCVLLDHLQYMQTEPHCSDPYIAVTEITKYMKAIAREWNLPVILLCQLNRAVESRDTHRPRLSDLRDSGSIEQDADQIWFIYRPGYYEPHATSNAAEIIVAKNRNGATGIAQVYWNAATMSFKKPPSLSDI